MTPVMYQRFRRKIFWHVDGRTAIIDFGTRNQPEKQNVSWYPSRTLALLEDGNYEDDTSWVLQWDTMIADTFTTKAGLMLYLIRMVYSVEAGRLIPSEILYDAGLQYTERWVDSWAELDHGDLHIVEIQNLKDLEVPKNRKLQLEPYIHIPRGIQQTQSHQTRSYPRKITHMDLEETEYVPKERIRFREIGPDWEDPCPWYKKDYARPCAELITKYHASDDEGEELSRRLRAALSVHSSD